MKKDDVGVLKKHMLVKVNDQYGIVYMVHEPEWIDHKTRSFRKELQGADIVFDGLKDESTYVHADAIEIVSTL